MALVMPSTARAQSVSEGNSGRSMSMKIQIVIGDQVVLVTLDDNATSRDFVAMLPLTLSFDDYAATEKIAMLPRKLSTAGAPSGTAAEVGDVTYYAPWGNLAIFHKPFPHAAGLVRLGRIVSGLEHLLALGKMPARIERVPR